MYITTKEVTSTKAYDYEMTLDYSQILDEFDLKYSVSEYYWQVGKVKAVRGWVLHLSVVKIQVLELLQKVLPLLAEEGVSFKLIRDPHLASWALDGNLGSEFLAKIVSIYPADDNQAIRLAKRLVSSTAIFKGPVIPLAHWLGGVVYTNFLNTTESPLSEWLFKEIRHADKINSQILLNYKYYPIATIKDDAKGDVLKALYFRNFWQIKSCIIKQGRRNMFCDNSGRDIKDRLLWQAELSNHIKSIIPLPRVIDSFEQNGDFYLAMEFIDGISLTNIFDGLCKDSPWPRIHHVHQLELLDFLLKVISIIDNLHKNGFVHRDITPENFLVDKQHNIWLIDLELMWSSNHRKPNPPFGLGTPGFISPEQSKVENPSINEDIYALGAFMVHVFTGMHPTKLLSSPSNVLAENLYFLIQNKTIAGLISSCVENDHLLRPDLNTISTTLNLYKEQLQTQALVSSNPASKINYDTDITLIIKTIQAAVNGLNNPAMLRQDSTWLSTAVTVGDQFGNQQFGTSTYNGWFKGVAGPLWLLAVAKKCGFDVETCLSVYNNGWAYLDRHYFNATTVDSGLYAGGAGIALALASGLDSSLLSSAHSEFLFDKCFLQQTSKFSLADGMAGQGTALLSAHRWMDPKFFEERLSVVIRTILGMQKKDGSWELDIPTIKNSNANLTLNDGVPGIIWFLLNYLKFNPDSDVNKSAIRALDWLIRIANHKKGNTYIWPVIYNSRASTLWSTDRGIQGITLVFIKAYDVLGDNIYRKIAEANLQATPDQPVIMNFTLGDGLAGLGEVYLEAAKVFKNYDWNDRAEWIAQFFHHTFQNTSDQDGHWLPEGNTTYTADLFTGCSGIIHFLMRYIFPDRVSHPLNPSYE